MIASLLLPHQQPFTVVSNHLQLWDRSYDPPNRTCRTRHLWRQWVKPEPSWSWHSQWIVIFPNILLSLAKYNLPWSSTNHHSSALSYNVIYIYPRSLMIFELPLIKSPEIINQGSLAAAQVLLFGSGSKGCAPHPLLSLASAFSPHMATWQGVLQGGLSNETGFFVRFNGDWCIQSGFFCYKKVWWFDLLSHQSRHPKYISGDSWPVYGWAKTYGTISDLRARATKKKPAIVMFDLWGTGFWLIHTYPHMIDLSLQLLSVFEAVHGAAWGVFLCSRPSAVQRRGGFSSLTRCYKMPHWLQLWKPFGISWDMWGEAWLRMVDSG